MVTVAESRRASAKWLRSLVLTGLATAIAIHFQVTH